MTDANQERERVAFESHVRVGVLHSVPDAMDKIDALLERKAWGYKNSHIDARWQSWLARAALGGGDEKPVAWAVVNPKMASPILSCDEQTARLCAAMDGDEVVPLYRRPAPALPVGSAASVEEWAEVVRDAWVEWAKTLPLPKPSWLVPWAECDEETRDADRAIARAVLARLAAPSSAVSAPTALIEELLSSLRPWIGQHRTARGDIDPRALGFIRLIDSALISLRALPPLAPAGLTGEERAFYEAALAAEALGIEAHDHQPLSGEELGVLRESRDARRTAYFAMLASRRPTSNGGG